MPTRLPLILAALLAAPALAAQEPTAREVASHGYPKAIELKLGKARAVLCPQAGGRVLGFSVDGTDAMYFDDAEKEWKPGKPGPITAGRFDYGPELTVAPHPKAWAGEWRAEIARNGTAKLTSPPDDPGGIQLVREFRLIPHAGSVGLSCTQTMTNAGKEVREVCHWGRSFSPGGGICVVPLGDRPSRFPSKYAMYEDAAVINVKPADENIRERDGFLEILAPPRKPKLGFDATAGWLAYVMPNGSAFVKRFAVYPDRVYNEAAGLTLSVWYPTGPRIELEPIGPRERLKPGESASFTEVWWLLPHPFPKKGGQLDLKALSEQVAKQTAAPPEPKPAPTKPTSRTAKTVEGWTVRVDDRLLSGPDAELGTRCLQFLEQKLADIKRVVPADKVKKLQAVTIVLDLTHGNLGPMQYHPSAGWLKDNGYSPDLARCVHLPRAADVVTTRNTREQPWVILHELAHAYHDQVLGFDDPRVREAYDNYKKGGRGDKTLLYDGRRVKHYALTNEKEFFAEMTESYFGTNDFFPFNRAELKESEPEIYELMKHVWDAPPAKKEKP